MEIRTADWKHEKHVPVIQVPGRVKPGEPVDIIVTVGKEQPHPNTPEHHISWVELYFIPEGKDIAYYLGRAEFGAHGEEQMYTEPVALFRVALPGSGTLRALAHCNIHGLWEGERRVEVK